MQRQTMRKLTPMQLETLELFYYGEVRLQHVRIRNYNTFVYITIEGINISGRVTSLLRRKLLKLQFPKNLGDGIGGMVVWITEAGIKEMEAIDA